MPILWRAKLKLVACWAKIAYPHGESVGETDLLYGTHMTGLRCRKCRKIVLDY